MSSTQEPFGLRHQSDVRLILRLLGPVVLVIGLVFCVIGFADFLSEMDSFEEPTRFWTLFVGMPLLVLGLAMSSVGRVGAQSRYDCRHCGTRNDEAASSCDSCGQSLA